MTTSRPHRLAALALVTTLTLSACASTSNNSTDDPSSASASPSPSVSESAAPSVPTDWQTVDLRDVAEISVPPDWTVKTTTPKLHHLSAPKDMTGFPPGKATVGVGSLPGGDQENALESSAKWAMETDYAGYNPKRLPNEVINGTTFYRLQFDSEAVWYDVYGTVTPDGEYNIEFDWEADKVIDRKEAEAIWSAVMPTFKML